jgi:hypothetical protein
MRWKPYYAAMATLAIARCVVTGVESYKWHTDRASYYKHVWTCYMGLAAMEMRHYYTFEEMKNDLR